MKGLAPIPRFVFVFLFVLAAVAAKCQVGQWVVKAHMINARREFAAVTGSDGRIYAIGGNASNAQGSRPQVEAYDPNTDTWTALAPMPYGRANFGAAATANGKIYVFGGSCEPPGTAHSCLVYNISSNSWSSNVADIPDDMNPSTAVLGNDGNIVVQTGPSILGRRVRIYHPSTNTWTKPPTLPPATTENGPAVAAAANGLSCFVGGFDDSNNASSSFDIYDSNGDVWSSDYSLPQPRAEAAAAVGGDKRLYIMGGYGGGGTHSVLVWAFNFVSHHWDTVPNMLRERSSSAGASDFNGTVYVLGGNILDGGDTDEVEAFTPPFLQAIGYNLSAEEGTAFSGAVVTFTDNISDTAGNFSATIDWGDGTQTSGSIVNTGSGAFDVRGTHTYAEEGPYNTTVALYDADGESLSVNGTFTVSDASLSGSGQSPSAYRAVQFSGKVATFSDSNPAGTVADFSATINWGDGSGNSTGSVVIDPSGGFAVNGSHTYPSTGSYSLSVKITDVGGATVAVGGLMTVVEPPPVVSAGTINTSEGALFNGQVATFTDADPNLVAGDFTATINWGDGVTSSGNVVTDGAGGFKVNANHIYLEEGNLPVLVTVSVGGSSGSSTGIAAVADGILTATGYNLIEKGTTFSDTVATFTDADPGGVVGDYTAGIVWGDGKSSNGTIVAFGSGWKVVGSHSYLKRGKYVVTIHIKDIGGSTANATTNINVGPVK